MQSAGCRVQGAERRLETGDWRLETLLAPKKLWPLFVSTCSNSALQSPVSSPHLSVGIASFSPPAIASISPPFAAQCSSPSLLGPGTLPAAQIVGCHLGMGLGALLEHRILLPDGRTLDVAWKAWPSSDESHLRWELKRILPTAGYHGRSHGTKVCARVAKQVPLWNQLFEALGWSPADCQGESRHSLQAKQAASSASVESAEQGFWVSTNLWHLRSFFLEVVTTSHF